MRSRGTVSTYGRPLCISLKEMVHSWSGFPLADPNSNWIDTNSRIATVINEEGVRFAVLQLTTGRCEVLSSHEEIAIVEIVESPDDYTLEDGLLSFEGVEVHPNVLKLSGFGGSVVLFDSARLGEELRLQGGQHEADHEPSTSETSLEVTVIQGFWSVSLFEIEQPDLLLKGAWLQREGQRS